MGGMFIATSVRVSVGDKVRLWLQVPALESDREGQFVRLQGEVRWLSNATPTGFGVAFRALTAADENRLHTHFSKVCEPMI